MQALCAALCKFIIMTCTETGILSSVCLQLHCCIYWEKVVKTIICYRFRLHQKSLLYVCATKHSYYAMPKCILKLSCLLSSRCCLCRQILKLKRYFIMYFQYRSSNYILPGYLMKLLSVYAEIQVCTYQKILYFVAVTIVHWYRTADVSVTRRYSTALLCGKELLQLV